ncbi:MAG: hypothetical protein ACI85O_001796 [Saprospiraceae bacterium]|jgi:hypothetical protein
MFNSQKFSFLAILFVLASTIAFTSCNDDEMVDPDPNPVMCDSFGVSITGNDSLVFANVFGGTEPYTYSWSEGSTGSSIDIFAAGNYSVTVTDANGCTGEGSITIEEQPIDDCADFAGSISEDSGTLTAEGTGGTPPYSYIWNDSLTTTQTLEVTESGTYGVYITDNNGCGTYVSYDYNTIPCSGFFVDIDVSPDSLSNNNTSILNGYPTGGTSPYAYTWSQGSIEPILYEVMAGTYAVTVVDANGCTAEDEVIVE